jgi:hypothetical protein
MTSNKKIYKLNPIFRKKTTSNIEKDKQCSKLKSPLKTCRDGACHCQCVHVLVVEWWGDLLKPNRPTLIPKRQNHGSLYSSFFKIKIASFDNASLTWYKLAHQMLNFLLKICSIHMAENNS